MSAAIPFEQVGRLPATGDNVAIAVRRLDAGTVVEYGSTRFGLPVTILEGHRFAITPIAADQALLSWGLPFAFALRDIAAGEYVCNEKPVTGALSNAVKAESNAASAHTMVDSRRTGIPSNRVRSTLPAAARVPSPAHVPPWSRENTSTSWMPLAEAWRPYCSVAAWYLWRSLENQAAL